MFTVTCYRTDERTADTEVHTPARSPSSRSEIIIIPPGIFIPPGLSPASRVATAMRRASRAFARADTFQNNIQPHRSERTSHPVRVLALSAFSRHRARHSAAPYPSLSFPTSSPELPISVYLAPSLPLPPTFLSSSQQRFFRTHTPPRINNSPYEFTRSGRASEDANERTNERASESASERRHERAGWRTGD